MFQRSRVKRVLIRCYRGLSEAYGYGTAYTAEQLKRVVAIQRVNDKYLPIANALFLSKDGYGAVSDLDYGTVRKSILVNYFGYDPTSILPESLDFRVVLGLDAKDLHTPIGPNQNAFYGGSR